MAQQRDLQVSTPANSKLFVKYCKKIRGACKLQSTIHLMSWFRTMNSLETTLVHGLKK